MQIGQFLLKLYQGMMEIAGDVTGAAGAVPTLVAVSTMAPTTLGCWPMPR